MNGAGATAGSNIFQECRVALVATGDAAVDPLIATMKHENADVEADAKKRDFFPGIIVDKTSSVLGDLHVPSAALFDLGVFSVVLGSSMLLLTALGHQSLRARRRGRGGAA